jgi:phosphoglycerate dehydrogenase-like enzyme
MGRPTVVLAMVPVLTADLFTPAHQERLRTLCEVPDPEPLTRLDDARAKALLPRAEILLTGWGCPPIDEQALSQASLLQAIVHAAGTLKNHVREVCFERGIRVSSAAAANAVPVAEYTLAAILLAGKRAFRLQRMYAEVRAGRWWPQEVALPGNYRRGVGSVGAAHVGRLVMERLRSFDFLLLVHDPYLDAEEARRMGAEPVGLDELLQRSHVVSLHAPALPETQHMIDRRRLGLLCDGAVLVNTARGALVDQEALTDELVAGRIDAVIDTTEPEILPADSPLYDLPNVFLTPHVAGAMGLETQRMAELALDEIARYVRGEPFAHEVHKEDLARIA